MKVLLLSSVKLKRRSRAGNQTSRSRVPQLINVHFSPKNTDRKESFSFCHNYRYNIKEDYGQAKATSQRVIQGSQLFGWEGALLVADTQGNHFSLKPRQHQHNSCQFSCRSHFVSAGDFIAKATSGYFLSVLALISFQ
jgi:hypothetical protein